LCTEKDLNEEQVSSR